MRAPMPTPRARAPPRTTIVRARRGVLVEKSTLPLSGASSRAERAFGPASSQPLRSRPIRPCWRSWLASHAELDGAHAGGRDAFRGGHGLRAAIGLDGYGHEEAGGQHDGCDESPAEARHCGIVAPRSG